MFAIASLMAGSVVGPSAVAAPPTSVGVVGDFTGEIGCATDWDVACTATRLTRRADGTWSVPLSLPAGRHSYKAALNGSWSENYGAGAVANGPNIALEVPAGGARVTFAYDPVTHWITDDVNHRIVTAAGSFQSELACADDWAPDCLKSWLQDIDGDGTYTWSTNAIPAGTHHVKAAIGQSWAENYGQNGVRGGADIPFTVPSAGATTSFSYNSATHVLTVTSHGGGGGTLAVVAAGDFQSELGCAGDWSPSCGNSRLSDTDGDGTYTFSTTAIPAGAWQVKATIGGSWDENYGQDGTPNGANIAFTVSGNGAKTDFAYNATSHLLTARSDGGIGAPGPGTPPEAGIKAHWLSRKHIAWDRATGTGTYYLYTRPDGDVRIGAPSRAIKLEPVPGGLPADLRRAFPRQADLGALALPDGIAEADIEKILTGDVAVAAFDGASLRASTRLRNHGVLDDVHASARTRALGPMWTAGVPALHLWAPTARSVKVNLYDDATTGTPSSTVDLAAGGDGVWTATGNATWKNKFYLFDVEVLADNGSFQRHQVTDPYSVGLSTNGTRSALLDLADPALAPAGWTSLAKPALAKPEDQAIYELHIRDFSIGDTTVPAADRGTYRAFTHAGSNGMKHLADLARAGLTTVHLLPFADFTIQEQRSQHQNPQCDLRSMARDSDQQQSCVNAVANSDGFDWGYNTQHYTVPEGSFATDPQGGARTLQTRQMVAGLNGAGLRAVMDVVYNHTPDAGPSGTNNLDRIVPGYYHRLNAEGQVENSTCCPNTAAEHAMMGKLLVDSVLTWAKAYKIDGFRFDLMGHHPKSVLTDLRAALDTLTVAKDGVDGKAVYLYGEGWDFGEVAGNTLFTQATQVNMAGTGVGTFNDRIRDAVRGGGPADANPRAQGFASGLFTASNGDGVNGDSTAQKTKLLLQQDQIKVGLTGNLKDYSFVDRTGATVKGSQVPYGGSPTGYTSDPQESVAYVDAHDDLVLFDNLTYKLPTGTTMADRIRAQSLALSIPALSQGVAFWHAGSEMLRSKSFDSNSYNSGDWFNVYDPTKTDNGFGRGLPASERARSQWSYATPLLADPALKPSPADIAKAAAQSKDFLTIRATNPLFRLATAAQVQQKVSFPDSGPNQKPGVIVMRIDDTTGADVDPNVKGLVVIFNAGTQPTSHTLAAAQGAGYTLDPTQAAGSDPVVKTATFTPSTGTFTVPPRTTAVFRLIQ
ncbi:pullulanase-type alpha-1,6-glucosidase [Lentzea pudingi]|uniref:pullulanase-type alpha-1,6-glucosidase n=1 Tax=Lentzea pudingi TaxID=1789439 RepID=UPI001665C9E0|nr:pullulanase-type alpha-1,6-glucosidase [Lentzea pudingi]